MEAAAAYNRDELGDCSEVGSSAWLLVSVAPAHCGPAIFLAPVPQKQPSVVPAHCGLAIFLAPVPQKQPSTERVMMQCRRCPSA